MFRLIMPALVAACVLAPTAAPADDTDTVRSLFAGDRYVAGQDIEILEPTSGDLFAAGEEITLEANVEGAAHLAARRLSVEAEIGGPLYAAAYDVEVSGPVSGPMSIFAAEAQLDGMFGGNIRVFAAEIELQGNLAGSAMLAADEIDFDARVAGDVMLSAGSIAFDDDAQIEGRLIIYADPEAAPEVPESVIAPDRIELRDPAQWDGDTRMDRGDMGRAAMRAAVAAFVYSVLLVAAMSAIAVVLAPDHVATWRERALAAPVKSLVSGFVAVSLVTGAGLVLALTVIGLPLLPAALFIGALAAFAGYVLGSYILGVWLWQLFGNAIPSETLPRIGLAVLGAFVAGILGLIPFLGWLFVMALALFGLGALLATYRDRLMAG